MKEAEGRVLSLTGELAMVKIGRHQDCSGCGACGGSQNLVIEALNEPGAQVGQRVKVLSTENNLLRGAFIIFIFPLLLTALGAGLGFWLADAAAVGGIIFFAIALFIVRRYDRLAARKLSEKPRIEEILPHIPQ